MRATLQEIFRRGFESYAQSRRLPRHVIRAARDIERCRTAECGRHVRVCPQGHVARVFYNSCRHRACPQCAPARVDSWIDARSEHLLACDHYHVIFTVPHELEPLWHRNRARMNDRLFRAARDTLLELLADPKYLGARPGILAALHTWGRTLTFHPHIHALVTGGGWDGQSFKPVRNGFLLPFRVVRVLFRGKLLAAVREDLAQRRLLLPEGESETHLSNVVRRLGRRNWNVHVCERYPHARGVVSYLGRYLRGGPIANRRLLRVDAHTVDFKYTDPRDHRTKQMRLSMEQFIQRIAWHVPEPGRHLVRYWGLYARGLTTQLEQARAALPASPPPSPAARLHSSPHPCAPRSSQRECPLCGQRLIFLAILGPLARDPPMIPPS